MFNKKKNKSHSAMLYNWASALVKPRYQDYNKIKEFIPFTSKSHGRYWSILNSMGFLSNT